MLGWLFRCGRRTPLICGVAALLCAQVLVRLGSIVQAGCVVVQTETPFDPFKYLPVGARLQRPEKDVVSADLDGDGRKEIVLFYVRGDTPDEYQANILVLKQTGNGYGKFWEDIYKGSEGFGELTGIYDLRRSGRPQIVVYRTIGASCYGVLDIYEYRRGKLEAIAGDWGSREVCREVVIEDLDGDGVPEIIIRGRKNHGENHDIYRWNGRRYTRSNNEFPWYYDGELETLLHALRSPVLLPVSAREMWIVQAVEIYMLQQRFSEAIQLCQEILQMIDDPQLTAPNVRLKGGETPEMLARISQYFEVEKLEGKATIHRLLGDVHKAAGDIEQAEEYYRKADELRAKAKERRSKLLH